MPTVYLYEGPCDGKQPNISESAYKAGVTYCGGQAYINVPDLNVGGFTGANVYQWKWGKDHPDQVQAPRAHGGWKSLQRSLNQTMPTALKSASHHTSAALHSLSNGRKVRL